MSLDGAEAWGPTYSERDSVADRISFESGVHRTTSEVRPDLEAGNLKAKAWNEEVGKRISSQVLAIDSISPVFENDLYHSKPNDPTNDELDYPIQDKKDLFVWQPVTDREVLVVGGDVNYAGPGEDFTRSIPDGKMKEELVNRAWDKNSDERNEFLTEFVAEQALTGAIGFLTTALLLELGKQQSDKTEIGSPDSPKHFSRRKFLKLGASIAAAGTALYVGGRAAASTLMPYAPNETLHEIGEKVLELTPQPKLFEQHWLDGRTALLIEKCDAALRQGQTPPDAKGTVVIGNAHSLEASNLLKSSKARSRAIHSYAKDLVHFYDKILDDYPQVNKSWAINRMLDYIARADLVAVSPPEEETVDNKDVNVVVDKNVRYLFSFTTPAIVEAISDLYRPENNPIAAEELVKQQPTETPPATPTPKPPQPLLIPKAP